MAQGKADKVEPEIRPLGDVQREQLQSLLSGIKVLIGPMAYWSTRRATELTEKALELVGGPVEVDLDELFGETKTD